VIPVADGQSGRADLEAADVLRKWLGADGDVPSDWSTELQRLLIEREVDLDPVLRLIVDEATRRLDADRGTLYLVDHAKAELVSRVAHLPEIAEIRLRLGEGVAGWVAESGRLLNVPAEPRIRVSPVASISSPATARPACWRSRFAALVPRFRTVRSSPSSRC